MKPQLVANGPNQLWSWAITRLLTVVVGTFYYLYVVLDVYSRYVWAGCSPRRNRLNSPSS